MAPFPENFNARKIKPFRLCSVNECYREQYANTSDLCKKHHLYNWRHGYVNERTRFDPNEIEIAHDCALLHLYDSEGKLVAKSKIDIDDVYKVSQYRWGLDNNNYVLNAKLGRIHNLVMGVRARHDHINHDTLDNRKSNLRICTNQQNAFNIRIPKTNTSGAKGVSFEKRRGKFEAYITCNKRRFLGYYDNVIDAAKAYNKAASELFGEFAKLNDIEALERKQQAAQPT